MSIWDRFLAWLRRFWRKPEPPPPEPEPEPEPEPTPEPERVTYGGDVVKYDGEDVTYGLPVS